MLLQFLLEMDGKILLFIQDYLRVGWLTQAMKFITSLGDRGMIWIVLAAILLCMKQYRKTGTAMAVALLIGFLATNLILKNLVLRVRPYDAVMGLHALIGPLGDSSFPSGHTTSAIAASFVMLKGTPRYLGISAFVLAILIAFSRLYLGVHYPTDVLVGAFIGLFAAFCGKYVVKA
jgi:undecaprenyl-diphosphatase